MDARRFRHIVDRCNPEEIAEVRQELLDDYFTINSKYPNDRGWDSWKRQILAQVRSLDEAPDLKTRRDIGTIWDLVQEGLALAGRELPLMKVTKHEHKLAQVLADHGYSVLRNGWPDFLVTDGVQTFGVEVKRPREKVRSE